MEYLVNWSYRSSLGGPWQAGERITIDPALADAINRDSPGVLSPAETVRADRMVKTSRTRKVVEETPNEST
jgi:hypothetical protein